MHETSMVVEPNHGTGKAPAETVNNVLSRSTTYPDTSVKHDPSQHTEFGLGIRPHGVSGRALHGVHAWCYRLARSGCAVAWCGPSLPRGAGGLSAGGERPQGLAGGACP